MKKKIISLFLTVGMTLSLLAGCGDRKTTQSSQQPPDSQSVQDTQGEASVVTYDYEQPLNIIDDNYRNYYEIFVYSFYDSDGDGIGDLKGVLDKLDYVADMGFNGIWLMPIMPSPTYHKYDITDYQAIDEAYGTMDDFEALVQGCHDRGIRLIIDFVINHTSSQHPWFQEACAYLQQLSQDEEPDTGECPYFDYYHFSRTQPDSTYYPVGESGWYYEGAFWSEMPDLNLTSKAVQSEIKKIAKFWMDKGVDGFRMDAALHYDEEDGQANVEILKWLYGYCEGLHPDFYMVSEVWASKETISSYYKSGTPSMFNFDASSAEGLLVKTAMGTSSAVRLVDTMIEYQELYGQLNPDFIDAPFLTNHDQARVANNLRSDETLMKMAAGLLLTMSGSPFVYYGEEIGMKSSGTKDENKRLPMNWSATDTTGITDGPEDADDGIEQTFAPVDEQQQDDLSLWNYYKRALRIRNENPEIARGTIEKVDSLCNDGQAAITKTYEDNTIGIVYNISDEKTTLTMSGTPLADMAIRGYLTTDGSSVTLADATLTLPAHAIAILGEQ